MPEGTIKKRKRETKDVAEDIEDGLDAMEVFRRHFERQFAPLKEVGVKKVKKAQKVEANDEWEGLSEEDDAFAEALDERAPEVIEFTSKDPLLETTKLPKGILKPFISSKPPSIIPSTPKSKKYSPGGDEDEDTTVEASLLKNDLALQRLLRESHLLDSSSTTLEATGKNRLKALESRVQALGGKDITVQKMPMAARKGIDAAKKMREQKRRAHAKEAGIILEKEVRAKKDVKKRDRGFGPSIGSFRNGILVLSKRDVMDIEGRAGGGGRVGKGKSFKGGKSGKGGKKRR